MTKRMLIDTTHGEETRVVVLDGNRLEDYDVETSAKKQLKGNIYLAKVVRVEPSLQAAFIEYGGNRHGFLAFSEIHPDYYQIPIADRERLIALQEEEARADEAREEAREPAAESPYEGDAAEAEGDDAGSRRGDGESDDGGRNEDGLDEGGADEDGRDAAALAISYDAREGYGGARELSPIDRTDFTQPEAANDHAPDGQETGGQDPDGGARNGAEPPQAVPETLGGESDGADDGRPASQSTRFLRHYKIQEVIRRRQILLIQVVKEERGNKGAALTTYISLAGRFCVLMPNSLRGGGVSRKITSAADRKRLKEITAALDIPRGMAMIIRTAGAQRPRPEIMRDCEYLLRLWDDVREQTLRAMAPALIYEEANLIKRAIRDVYTRDIEEIAVDGEAGWKAAREFMRNLMPANAQKVQLWRDHGQPLFSYYQVEHHLDAMLQPTVQLRSGGYLVINQTEALVAIDVNSGRSTRERGIEETALRTNLEAADEVARQLRLRDLAGLIVIDFIDMEARRHNAMVERRLKDALRNDRARIQVGQISAFGLMEMSRQRLRPSIAESSFVACSHCAGTGFVRGTDSAALHVLRAIEEEGAKQRAAEIVVYLAGAVALYVLNHKRVWLAEIEQRHRMTVTLAIDDSLIAPQSRIEKVRPQLAAPPASQPAPVTMAVSEVAAERFLPANGVVTHGVVETVEFEEPEDEADEVEATEADPTQGTPAAAASAAQREEEHKRRRRRRRRRGGRREDANGVSAADLPGSDTDQPGAQDDDVARAAQVDAGAPAEPDDDLDGGLDARTAGEVPLSEEQGGARKRGRRGGTRGRKPREPESGRPEQDGPPRAVPATPPYAGPTPADPFGGRFDIFDMIEQDAEPPPTLAVEPASTAAALAAAAGPQPEPAVEPPLGAEPEPVPEAEPALQPLAATPTETLPETATEPLAETATEAPAKPKRRRAAPTRTAPTRATTDAPVQALDLAPPQKVAKPRVRKARKADPVAEAVEPQLPAPPVASAPETPSAESGPAPAEPAEERPSNVVQPILIDVVESPPIRRTGWWKR